MSVKQRILWLWNTPERLLTSPFARRIFALAGHDESFSVWYRTFSMLGQYAGRFKFSIAMMIVNAAFSVMMVGLLKPIIDNVFDGRDERYLQFMPIVLVVAVLGKGFTDIFQDYLMADVGLRIINDFRVRMFRHIQRLSLSYFNENSTGVLIARIISDVNVIKTAVTQLIIDLFKNVISLVGFVGLAFYMNWQYASLAFLVLPVAFVPIVLFGRRSRKVSKKAQGRVGKLTTYLDEVIGGNRVVKAFGMEEYENERFETESDKLYRISRKVVSIDAISSPLNEMLGGLGGAMMVYIAGRSVLYGTMTTGELSAFIVSVFMMYKPIKSLSRLNNRLQTGLAAAERCFELLDTVPEIQDAPDARPLPRIRESIEIRDVTFAYGNKIDVLHDVNLTVRRGEVVALVGPSGGGKTTLVNLVPRFYDVTKGAILIDGNDIREVRQADLIGQIAIVTQQTILFNDTVRANIAYGDPSRSEKEIEAAAEAAHAMEFIRRLPQGMNTLIGEDGVKLSGGQRQRLAIARALLKDAPILILDEATSALDTESERQVQAALEELMRDRTTLVIAHRLSTIQNADRIVVLKGGRIVEEGTHAELLAAGGEYQRLHALQFRDTPLDGDGEAEEIGRVEGALAGGGARER